MVRNNTTCEIEGCDEARADNARRCVRHYCDGTQCYISWCEQPRSGLGGNAPSCFCDTHDELWMMAYREMNQFLDSFEKMALFVGSQTQS